MAENNNKLYVINLNSSISIFYSSQCIVLVSKVKKSADSVTQNFQVTMQNLFYASLMMPASDMTQQHFRSSLPSR